MTPWWTEADQAEQDVLVHDLVELYFEHRASCTERPCSHVTAAIRDLLDWRHGRMLRTRAAYLRAKQTLEEWKAA